MRNDIGSKSLLALSLFMFTVDLENIFLTSTIAFVFLFKDVDFRSLITSSPNNSINESGLKSWLTFYWMYWPAAFFASSS